MFKIKSTHCLIIKVNIVLFLAIILTQNIQQIEFFTHVGAYHFLPIIYSTRCCAFAAAKAQHRVERNQKNRIPPWVSQIASQQPTAE